MIKILFVGHGWVPMYELAFYSAALRNDELDPYIFTWKDEIEILRMKIKGRIENRLAVGKTIRIINDRLLRQCETEKYDIVFFYSCRYIFPRTIKSVKSTGSFIMTYNNDNPFSRSYPRYFWRHWRNSLKYCDSIYVYRKENIDDCKREGFGNVKLLRSYYNPERLYYIEDEKIKLDVPEVLFLGHHECDEREEYLKHLADNGIKVGIPDLKEWDSFGSSNTNIIRINDTHKRYNELLNKARICLVFLSKINHDTYTRRCFEIPAVKTLMMSVYTDDISSMFEGDKEVVFFEDKEELLRKTKFYLTNESERYRIAEAGYKRLIKDRHSSVDRVNQIIGDYKTQRELI